MATSATAATSAAMRAGEDMAGNLHGSPRARRCRVRWISSTAASSTRSGSSVGPSTSQAAAMRSNSRCVVMRDAPSGGRSGHPPRGPPGARMSRSAGGTSPCPAVRRVPRRSPAGSVPRSGAGRRWRLLRRQPAEAAFESITIDRRIAMSSRPFGPSAGRMRTFAAHSADAVPRRSRHGPGSVGARHRNDRRRAAAAARARP